MIYLSTMKNKILKTIQYFCLGVSIFMVSCQSETPQQFFDQAILNTNLLGDFEPFRFGKSLEETANASSGQNPGTDAQQVVDIKIQTIERALEKIKDLDANDEERKSIKETSIALFEAALPVYQNEYKQYAKLCDEKSTSEDKDKLLQKVNESDLPKIDQLMETIYQKGKVFAEKNQLNVHWGD